LAGLRNDQLKQKLLEEGDITLDQTLTKAEAFETAHIQLAAMGSQQHIKPGESTNRVRHQQYRNSQSNEEEQWPQRRNCSYCGGEYHRSLSDCPARGHECVICNKFDHYEEVCRQKQRNNSRETDGAPRRQQQQPAAKESMSKARFIYHGGDSTDEEEHNAFLIRSFVTENESDDDGSEEEVTWSRPQQQQQQK